MQTTNNAQMGLLDSLMIVTSTNEFWNDMVKLAWPSVKVRAARLVYGIVTAGTLKNRWRKNFMGLGVSQ